MMRRLPVPALLRRLACSNGAFAMIEFAFCFPLLLALTLWLFEITNYALVRQRVSQLALQISDNASRIGTQNSVQTEIDESQVNDLFLGASLQSGNLDLAHRGRVILSSLEVDPTSPYGNYIHWQRCFGSLSYSSHYGVQGDGKGNNSVTGMGPANGRISATSTAPVMFVEIGYQYQPIISGKWVPSGNFQEIAALIVRDNRDTSGPGINPVAGVTPSTC